MIFVSVLDEYRFDISGITKQARQGWAHSLVQFFDYLDSDLEAIRLNNRFYGDYVDGRVDNPVSHTIIDTKMQNKKFICKSDEKYLEKGCGRNECLKKKLQ